MKVMKWLTWLRNWIKEFEEAVEDALDVGEESDG